MSVNEEESFEYDYEKENKSQRRFNRQSLEILEEGTLHLLVLNFYGCLHVGVLNDVWLFKILNFIIFFMCSQYFQMKYDENTPIRIGWILIYVHFKEEIHDQQTQAMQYLFI